LRRRNTGYVAASKFLDRERAIRYCSDPFSVINPVDESEAFKHTT